VFFAREARFEQANTEVITRYFRGKDFFMSKVRLSPNQAASQPKLETSRALVAVFLLSFFCRPSHTGSHECQSLLRDLIVQIESKETMLRQDDSLYDADSLLDLQQSKHAIQVSSVWKMVINILRYLLLFFIFFICTGM